jgi:hypothetical protein
LASLDELLVLLDRADQAAGTDSVVTSMRMPAALRQALMVAVELGMDAHANEAANRALRARLEAFVERQGLEQHYRRNPGSRPSLAAVGQALAELDHDSLADQPELIEQASREVVVAKPDADGDDVLLWAASLRAHHWSPVPGRKGRA